MNNEVIETRIILQFKARPVERKILETLKESPNELTPLLIARIGHLGVETVRTYLTSFLLREGYVERQTKGCYKISPKGVCLLQEVLRMDLTTTRR